MRNSKKTNKLMNNRPIKSKGTGEGDSPGDPKKGM
jgi:hypothetical protein